MKKFMSVLLALTLVFTVFAFTSANDVSAEATSTCTTGYTVFVHYHRWDDTYTDTTIWSWGYGTLGSGEGTGVHEEDGFGAVYQICVDPADAGDELGLINKYSAAWGDGMTDRDGVDTDMNGTLDGNHKLIDIRDDLGALEGFVDGIKHVYVFEGSNEVIYDMDPNSMPLSDDVATIAVVYSDPALSYADWNIWTWDTGTLGSSVDPEGIPLVSSIGIDGGTSEDFRVAFINVDPADMAASIGFIMRTDSWEKKFDGDMSIDTTGLVAGDFKTVFYIAGEGDFYDNFAAFEAKVNLFEITSSKALGPGSVEVMFNKEVVTKVDDVDVFDATMFMLKDKDGTAVVVDSVSYNSTSEANDLFTLILNAPMTGDMSPYTVSYGVVDDMISSEFEIDSVPPVIQVFGATELQLELGDTYTLPVFEATDVVGEESVDVYDIKVKEGFGTISTRELGEYEIIIVATDKFGNMAEETITITVTDPCATDAAVPANNTTNLVALLVGLPLAAAAVVTTRRWS